MKIGEFQIHINSCVHCHCEHKSVFKSCDTGKKNAIASNKKVISYKKDQKLFEEGDYPVGAFCIKKGSVKVVAYSVAGQEKIVRIVGEGGIVGYEAVIAGKQYNLSAIAIEETVACMVYKNMIHGLLEHDQSFSKSLMTVASDTITSNYQIQAEISYGTVLSRLVTVLLDLDRLYEGKGIHMSKGNLAKLVGTVNETLSRSLRTLKENGLIDEKDRIITLNDRTKLKELALKPTSSRFSH